MSILFEDNELEVVSNIGENVVNEDEMRQPVSKILVGGGTPWGSTGTEYEAYSKDVNYDPVYGVVTFTDLYNNRYTIVNAPVTIKWDAYLKADDNILA